MSEQLGSNANELTITIPSSGERDWATSIRDNCFQKISDHSHEGSGTGKKLRGYLSLDQTEAILANNTTLKARDNAGSATVDVLKVDANDEVVLSTTVASAEFQDDGLTVVDNADNTKKIALDAASITTATTRTLTSPDASGTIVLEDNTATLTNKSIDSDNNTITNIVNADIKAAAAIALSKLAAVTASRALASDASGFIVSTSVTDTELGYVSGVTSAIQTQLNTKTDTGTANEITLTGTTIGIADDAVLPGTGAVTVPSGTEAQRPGAPANGMLRYNDDSSQFEGYAAGSWGQIGGGGGGLDSVNTQDFETDVDASSVTTGNNATFDGGGTIDGSVSDETTNPISGTTSLKYTAGSSSTNDYVNIETITLDDKAKGEFLGVTLYADMSNFSANVDFVVKTDEGDILTFTNTDILTGGESKARYAFNVFVPSTASSLEYGIHMINAPVNTETLLIDDIEFTLSPFVYKNLTDTNSVELSGNDGRAITVSTEDIHFSGSGTGWTSTGDTHYYTVQKSNSVISVSTGVKCTTGAQRSIFIYKNGSSHKMIDDPGDAGSGSRAGSYVSKKGEFVLGDQISIRFETAGGTLSNNSTEHHLTILEEWEAEHVITPAKSNITTYSGVFDGSAGASVSVVSQSTEGALSIAYVSTGIFTLDYSSLGLTVAPSIIGTGLNPSANTMVSIDSVSTTQATIDVSAVGSSSNRDFQIILQKQSADITNATFLAAVPTNVQNNASDYVTESGITIEGTTSNPTKPTTMDTDEIIWAQAGQNLKATYKYYASSLTGSAVGSGDYLFTLPNGLSFDSNVVDFYTTVEGGTSTWQLVNTQIIGHGNSNTGTVSAICVAVPYDATRFRIFSMEVANHGAIGSAYQSITQLDSFSIQIDAPIDGWTSAGTFLSATPVNKTAYLKDVKANTTDGGTATSGSYQTRTLNTVEGDSEIVSLSSNQFTLGAGKYEIQAKAPVYRTGSSKIKLRNITDSTDDIIGNSAAAPNDTTFGDHVNCHLEGMIEISSTKTFEIQNRVTTTSATVGHGLAASFGDDEIYTVVKITKIPSA